MHHQMLSNRPLERCGALLGSPRCSIVRQTPKWAAESPSMIRHCQIDSWQSQKGPRGTTHTPSHALSLGLIASSSPRLRQHRPFASSGLCIEFKSFVPTLTRERERVRESHGGNSGNGIGTGG